MASQIVLEQADALRIDGVGDGVAGGNWRTRARHASPLRMEAFVLHALRLAISAPPYPKPVRSTRHHYQTDECVAENGRGAHEIDAGLKQGIVGHIEVPTTCTILRKDSASIQRNLPSSGGTVGESAGEHDSNALVPAVGCDGEE